MRWVKRVLVGLAVALVMLAVAAVFLGKHRRGEQLVADAERLSQLRVRPVHRGPAEGTTVQACLGPVLDATPAALGAFSLDAPAKQKAALFEVLAARTPGELPEDVGADSDRLWPWAASVLACTRAPALGQEPGLGPFAVSDARHPARLGITEFVLGRLVAVRVLSQVQAGAPDDGLKVCSDGLALARDTVLDRGLSGASRAIVMMEALLPACGVAVDRASPAQRRAFVEELQRIRSGLPALTEAIDAECVRQQLAAWGDRLTPGQRGRLPAEAETLAAAGPGRGQLPRGSPGPLLYWGVYVQGLERLRRAEAAGVSDADFERIAHRDDWVASVLIGVPDMGRPWLPLRQQYATLARGLDLLESAARAADGEPLLAGVTSTRDGEALVVSTPWLPGQTKSVRLHLAGVRAPDAPEKK